MDALADAAFPGDNPPGPARPTPPHSVSHGPGPTMTHSPEVPAPASSPYKSGSGTKKAEASKTSDKPVSGEDKNRKYFFCPNLFLPSCNYFDIF